jgi:hypothetical protein
MKYSQKELKHKFKTMRKDKEAFLDHISGVDMYRQPFENGKFEARWFKNIDLDCDDESNAANWESPDEIIIL